MVNLGCVSEPALSTRDTRAPTHTTRLHPHHCLFGGLLLFTSLLPKEHKFALALSPRHLAVIAGVAFSLVLGLAGPAGAAVVLYQNSNANVYASGGQATALLNCIADAHDGVVTQPEVCDQITVHAGRIQLKGVLVLITTTTTPFKILYRNRDVNIWLSGGTATALYECIIDAQSRDGHIPEDPSPCPKVRGTGGNALALRGVSVEVDQP